MLQDNKTHAIIDDFQPVGAGQQGLAELVDWAIGILRRQYLVILFVAVLGAAVGAIYLAVTPPVYTAQTSLYVDLHRSPLGQQEGIFGNDPIEIDSQIQIVKSKAIASSVVKKFQLMSGPQFGLSKGLISHVLQFLFGNTTNPPSEQDSLERATAALEQGLAVDRIAGSRIITISYSSNNPERAAQIANAIASAYITDQLEAKYEANRVAANWLQERQLQLREQVDAAQRAVESFKKQNNIVTADGKLLDDKPVADLNSRLTAARAQVSEIAARLDRLQSIVRLGPSDSNVDGAIGEINSPIVTTLRQQYLELARREAEWSARYGHDHLAVVNLRTRMQEIRQSMFDELRRTTEMAKNDYQIAKKRQEEIEKQLADAVAQSRTTNQVQVTLSGLENAAATYRNIYDTFVQRYMGGTQEATFPITEARVISPASIPLQKSRPKTLLVLALSIFGGVGLGCGLGLLRDSMDRVFRTTKQIEEVLHLPCIAMVPLLKERQTEKLSRKETPEGNAIGRRPNKHDSRVFWTVIDSPLSSFAEAIRSIKLAIDLHLATRSCKVIGFTSTFPDEGKSTMAAALAQLIAQARGRVLLVDCDLRNPSITRMLAPEATVGVIDVLSGRSSIGDAIFKEPKANLAILPTGKKVPLFLTSEILGGEPMSKLFEVLRQNYDYIIVDLPPLQPIIDVRASTHLVDSYVLTVEWGRTKISAVEHALRSAHKIYDGLIGTILNKADMDSVPRYDGSGRYYSAKHYARYGLTE